MMKRFADALFELRYYVNRKAEKLLYGFAHVLPLALRRAIVVDAGAHATTGKWSHVEVPALTMVDMLKRMEQPNQ